MKKLILILAGILVVIAFTIISCSKSKENSPLKSIDLTPKTDNAKVLLLSSDADWKLIASKNIETISKLVNSNIDVNTFNFDYEVEFLKVIGISKGRYLQDVAQIKAAAKRLTLKYNLSSQTFSGECVSCKSNKTEELAKLKRTIHLFRENKLSFAKFQNLLISPSLVDPGGNACCPWRFYACVTFCAASIEVFPVYLMCCAICYDTYCCK